MACCIIHQWDSKAKKYTASAFKNHFKQFHVITHKNLLKIYACKWNWKGFWLKNCHVIGVLYLYEIFSKSITQYSTQLLVVVLSNIGNKNKIKKIETCSTFITPQEKRLLVNAYKIWFVNRYSGFKNFLVNENYFVISQPLVEPLLWHARNNS